MAVCNALAAKDNWSAKPVRRPALTTTGHVKKSDACSYRNGAERILPYAFVKTFAQPATLKRAKHALAWINPHIGFLEALDLSDRTLVGESIGAVLALTAAADVPERVRALYALNTYDYETRYGDGIRRGNWFANMIIGSLQIPVFGAIGASSKTAGFSRGLWEAVMPTT